MIILQCIAFVFHFVPSVLYFRQQYSNNKITILFKSLRENCLRLTVSTSQLTIINDNKTTLKSTLQPQSKYAHIIYSHKRTKRIKTYTIWYKQTFQIELILLNQF